MAQIDTDAMVEACCASLPASSSNPNERSKSQRPKGQPDDTLAAICRSSLSTARPGRGMDAHPSLGNQQNRLQISLPALRLLARMAPEALGGDFTGDKMPRGRHGWQWLCEAAGLGLLHWKAPGGQALTIGPDNMKAEIVWRLLADGAAVLI
jgi:hypothetical protein